MLSRKIFFFISALFFATFTPNNCDKNLEAVSNQIEKYLNQIIHRQISHKVNDELSFTILRLSPIITYAKKLFSVTTYESIFYDNLEITYIFDIIINHILSNEVEVRFSRVNLSSKVSLSSLLLFGLPDGTFSYYGPVFATVQTSFGDLGDYSIYKNAFTKNYPLVFNEIFQDHLRITLLKYPKTLIMIYFSLISKVIEKETSFSIQCCLSEGIEKAGIRDISYGYPKRIDSYSAIFFNVEMELTYWKNNNPILVHLFIESMLFASGEISVGTTKPNNPIFKEIVCEIFKRVYNEFV